MTDPRFYQIALTMIKGAGDIICRKLLEVTGEPEALFNEKPKNLELIKGIPAPVVREIFNPEVLRGAEKELDFVEKNHISVYFYTDSHYSYRLKDCYDAPILYYSKGHFDLNGKHIISVVGTRKASWYGRDLIDKLMKDLKDLLPDAVIISGLAYGIDIHAHRAALKNGLCTIGILAHGLDRIYPAVHRQTAVEMLDRGGLLTDFPSGTNPDRQNFLKRNRIVAGLADATIVVESAEKGGSLVTADLAFAYGREVFAFPGRTSDPFSKGCNKIIRQQKAALITCLSDLLDLIGWDSTAEKQKKDKQTEIVFHSEEMEKVLALLKAQEEINLNEISRVLSVPVYELSTLLFELEMEGLVKALPGNRYIFSG